MAIRERKGRARPWQCYWNNPFTGKRESLSFATKEEAEKEDSLVKHRLRFERESFQQKEDVEKRNEVTLEQAFLLYLRNKQFSKMSLHWQMTAMRLPLREIGSLPLSAITIDRLNAIMTLHNESGLKPGTVRGRMSVLKTILRWSAENGFCEFPKFPRLPAPNYEKFIPPTPGELAAIMSVAPPHIQRVVIIGAQFGCRVGPSELFQLTWEDVDFTQGILRVHGAKKNPQTQWREVPIRESLVELLAQWAMQDNLEGVKWIIHFDGKPVKSIKNAWWSALERAGIKRKIRPYDLRHAFATELIAAGADIGTVAKLMGHSSPIMILNHYQYVMDKQKREAVESLPEFFSMCPNHVPKSEGVGDMHPNSLK